MFNLGTAVGYLMLDTTKFEGGLKQAGSGVKTFLDGSARMDDRLSALGSSFSKIGGGMTKGVTLPLLGAGAAALALGNEFEAQMSRVQGISGATGDQLEKLTDTALQLGADTSFSATQAAQGMENLASAGFTVDEIISAMPGLLDLAASSGADLATSAEIAASAVRGFGLEADDATHVADVFAEAAARTNAQTEDMGEAMKYIAPVARAMGQSLEDTAAAVGILSDAGIKGGQAGTSLRGSLSRLAKPSKEAKELMEELGLTFYDTEGNMKSYAGIVEELQKGMTGLTQEQQNNALVTLFGQESLSGMLALIQRGPEELTALSNSFKEADGAAADMSDTMLDNTKGSIEQMIGSLETLAITVQQILAPIVKEAADKITSLINSFNSMDKGTQQVIVAILRIVAALGPVMLIIGKVLGLASSVVTIVSGSSGVVAALGALGGSLSALLGPIALVVGAVVALVAAWITNFGGIRDKTAAIFASIQSIISSVLSIIVGLWNNNFANIQGIFMAVFGTLEAVVNHFFTMVQDVFNIFAAAFSGDWEAVWEGVKTLFVDFCTGIINILLNLLNAIIQAIIGIIGGVMDAVYSVFFAIANAFKKGWKSITDWFSKAVQDPVTAIKGIADALYNAGAEVFNSLWDGIKSIWSSITSWVEDSINWLIDKVSFWRSEADQLQGEKSGRAGGTPHAVGLDYVPYDGYRAILHEGEAVLTKQENRQRVTQSGGDTYNFYSPEPIDPVSARREMLRLKRQLAEGVI